MSTKTKFYKLLTGLMLLSCVTFAQPRLLEFTLSNITTPLVGNGFGPRTTNHVVTFDKDRHDDGKFKTQGSSPDPILAPFFATTISFQNQQHTGLTYGAGTVNGGGTSNAVTAGLVFGAGPSTALGVAPGTPNVQQASPLNSYEILGAFGGGGGPRNGMFMSNYANAPVANYPGASGNGIDAEGLFPSGADDATGAVSVFTCAQRMFDLGNPAGTADRFYYGDVVVQFSRSVANPVVHIAGLGGSYRYCPVGLDPNILTNWKSTFFSTELELVGPWTLTKMAGNEFMTISGKNIFNNAVTPNGESIDVGVVALPGFNNFGAATGSVRVDGPATNLLVFKVYLRGSDANALASGFNWSAPGSASGGSRDPLTGDIWFMSVSTALPQLSPLPVTGVVLKAALNGNDVSLNWKTQTEINSKQFEIERSTDGINFSQIAVKQAAGNTISEIQYSQIDPNMASSVYYYRLKMVDIDGKFTYSNVVVVRKSGGIKGVRTFPNPVTSQVNLEFSNAKGNYVVNVYSLNGQQVITEKASITNTVQYVTIDRKNLSPGTYFVSVKNTENGEVLFSDKIILQ